MKIFLAALCLLSLSPAFSAEKKKAAAAPAPEMDEAMKKMVEFGTPGAEHARLKPAAGTWSVKNTMWMAPGAKPETSTGSAYYSWILDGRLLKNEFKGDMGGMPFTGLGYSGYDKVRGEYFGTWMDSMSTGMAVTGGGAFDEKTNTITDTGSYADAMSGDKNKWFRNEWVIPSEKNPDTMTFRMFHKDEKGAEYKTMEMVYTRTK